MLIFLLFNFFLLNLAHTIFITNFYLKNINSPIIIHAISITKPQQYEKSLHFYWAFAIH